MKIRHLFKKKSAGVAIVDSSSYDPSGFNQPASGGRNFSPTRTASTAATAASATTITSASGLPAPVPGYPVAYDSGLAPAPLATPPPPPPSRPVPRKDVDKVTAAPVTVSANVAPSAPAALPAPLVPVPAPNNYTYNMGVTATRTTSQPRQASSSSSSSSSASFNSAHSSQYSSATSATSAPTSPMKNSYPPAAVSILSNNPFSNAYELQPAPAPPVPALNAYLPPVAASEPSSASNVSAGSSSRSNNSKTFLSFTRARPQSISDNSDYNSGSNNSRSSTSSSRSSTGAAKNKTTLGASAPAQRAESPSAAAPASNRASKYFSKPKKLVHASTATVGATTAGTSSSARPSFSSHFKKRASTFGPSSSSSTNSKSTLPSPNKALATGPGSAAAAASSSPAGPASSNRASSPNGSSLTSTDSESSGGPAASWPPPRMWIPVNEPLYNDYAARFDQRDPREYSDDPESDSDTTNLHRLQGFSVMSYNILSSLYTNRLDNTIINKTPVSNNSNNSIAHKPRTSSLLLPIGGPPSSATATTSPTSTTLRSRRERFALIIKEIKHYSPDIVCLQEVDAQEYYGQIHFDLANYDSIYAPKHALYNNSSNRNSVLGGGTSFSSATGSGSAASGGPRPLSMIMGAPKPASSSFQPLTGTAAKNHLPVEGSAIFFKMDRFQLLEKRIFNYADLTLYYKSAAAASKRETETLIDEDGLEAFAAERDTRERVAGRSNVGIVAVLRHVTSGKIIIVANTQLVADIKGPAGYVSKALQTSQDAKVFNDVRMIQIGLCLEQVEYFVLKYTPSEPCASADNGNKVPVLLCGDLNTAVGSGVYEMVTGATPVARIGEWQGRSYARFTDEQSRWKTSERLGLRSSYLAPPIYKYEEERGDRLLSNNPFKETDETTEGSRQPQVTPKHKEKSKGLKGAAQERKRTEVPHTDHLIPFTKLHPETADVSDYIWYSAPTLAVAEVLGPDPHQLQNAKSAGSPLSSLLAPSPRSSVSAGSTSIQSSSEGGVAASQQPNYPSDHICLMTKFMFKNQHF